MASNKILLVDDDEDILLFNKLILSDANFSVDTCNDPEEALTKCKSTDYDLFILDYIMPKMKGDELAEIIFNYKRLQGSYVNIMFLTGRLESTKYLERLGGGFNLVLVKPINAEDLLKAIRSKMKQPQVIYA